jgi:hypothetical protein
MPSAVTITAVLTAMALWAILGMAVMISVSVGIMLDLKARELLVPLWCWLSGDPATFDRLDAIVAARDETVPYEPRHALRGRELTDVRDRRMMDVQAQLWMARYHWGPWF